MADEAHLKILAQGVETWNQWRKENPEVRPDLIDADLSFASLSFVHLSGADLFGADLRNADLSFAQLSGADLFNAKLLRADLSRANLQNTQLRFANLSSANLSFANLSFAILNFADLSRVNLNFAHLIETQLSGGKLSYANLIGADLIDTNFSEANLTSAKLIGANLCRANLRSAKLNFADLSEANLSEANLSAVQVFYADLTGTTLTGVCLEDWQLNSATNLTNVQCDYIYRECNRQTQEFLNRLPADETQTFASGEFTQRFQLREHVLKTVDLTFTEGIDWQAFLTAFQALNAQHPQETIALQRIEAKGSVFVVGLHVDQGTNRGAIAQEAKQLYQAHLQALALQGEPGQSLAQARQHSTELSSIMAILAQHQHLGKTTLNGHHSGKAALDQNVEK